MAHLIGYPLFDKHNNLKKFKISNLIYVGYRQVKLEFWKVGWKQGKNRNNVKEMNFACEQSVARNPFYIDID